MVVAVIAALATAMFPRAGIAATAGVLFHPAAATVYVITGLLTGAVVAFGIGRVLGRPYFAAGPLHNGRLRMVEHWVLCRGLIAVIIARLLPVLPFGLLNYAFGITALRLPIFALGTAIGVLPSTVAYVTLGANITRPGSPLFIAATATSLALAIAGLLGARRTDRRPSAPLNGHRDPSC